ncbi:MAG: PKD domain protein [Euryarchaeota archaeon ADurb.Bin165]|nr:MAG: PKD domain protein [Euryarchaeota archaeon ADurb.Bin165]
MNSNIARGVLTALLCIFFCCMVVADNQELIFQDVSLQPMQFIENAGQAHEDILYQLKSAQFSFDFTRDALLVSGPSGDCETCGDETTAPLVVTIKGAGNDVIVEAFDKLDGYANFLKGNNESEWQKFVPWYGGIRYINILPGIDLSYSGKQGVLKREFTVREGIDPGLIRLVYGGNEGLSLTDDGSLQVKTSFGDLTERPPYSYQVIDGETIKVESSYQLLEDGEVGYYIGEYDHAYPLIIDPYLEYSTLLGGTLEDYGMDIAVDSSGDVYVTGYTSSCDFPLYNPTKISTAFLKYNGTYCHNSRDAFITKIGINQSTGNASIRFSTYLGGDHADFGRGIAVDSLKNIYVTGDTYSDNFPIMRPFAYGDRLHGSNDAFVIKLDPSGGNIRWSDYLGGNFADRANDIALDSLNAVYLTGQTVGNSPFKKLEQVFPTTPGAYQEKPNPDATMGDAFAVKISPDGQTLEYSTYISGSGHDYGTGIAVDGKGKAYIVGTTSSSNLLPPDVPGYQKSIKGAQDAFLFKMNFQAGLQPEYATYLGGSDGHDYGEAVAVSGDCAYVTGATASRDFPVTNMALQTVKGWEYDNFEKDAFVTKFDEDGDLIYSTYLGGTSDDWGYDIKVDDKGRAFVTGFSRSTNIPRRGLKYPIKQASGGKDGFLSVISSDGRSVESSTLFGGYRDDVGTGVAISPDGSTSYVTGYTSSPTMLNLECGEDCEKDAFPVYKWIDQTVYNKKHYNGGAFTGNYQGSSDAFVMKFGQPSLLLPSFKADPTCGPEEGETNLTVTFTETSSGTENILNRRWSFGDDTPIKDTGSVKMPVTHNYTSPGTYQATLTLHTYSDVLVSDPVDITYCNPDMSANFTVVGYKDQDGIIDVPIKKEISFSGYALNYTPASYKWQFGDGSKNQTGKTTHHSFTEQGTYTVNMTAPSGTCCDNYTNIKGSRQIRVLAPPMARFIVSETTPTDMCSPLTITFNDTSPSGTADYGAPSSWQWNFGDNSANATTRNVTHTYYHPGTYSVSLTVSNIAGSDTYQEKDLVKVSGVPKAGFTASPRTGKAPLGVQFTDTSKGVPTGWSWQFGDGETNNTQNPYHKYNNAGLYTVNLTVTNGCGVDSANYTKFITVNANNTPQILFGKDEFPPESENPVNGTPVLNVTFIGNTNDGTLIDTAVWDFGDGNTTTQTRKSGWPSDNSWFNITSHKYYSYGDYTPVLQITNATYGPGSSGGLYTDWIGVYPPLVVNFSITPPSGIVGQSILFTDLSEGEPVNWRWHFTDGSTNESGLSSVSHKFNVSGSYKAYLSIWNKYGAAKTGNKTLQITKADSSGVVKIVPQNVNLITESSNYRILNILLDKADYGLSSYKVKMDLNNSARAHIRDWAVSPPWVDHFTYVVSPAFDSITLSGYMNTGKLPAGSKNVPLGNISLIGISAGEANLKLNSSSVAQYGSSFMTLTGVPADIHVYEVGPLPGYSKKPGDIWPLGVHDGLIDDFDGNGQVNTKDVDVFFNTWVSEGFAGMPVTPFDYNSNDRIDTDDIVKFFNLIW